MEAGVWIPAFQFTDYSFSTFSWLSSVSGSLPYPKGVVERVINNAWVIFGTCLTFNTYELPLHTQHLRTWVNFKDKMKSSLVFCTELVEHLIIAYCLLYVHSERAIICLQSSSNLQSSRKNNCSFFCWLKNCNSILRICMQGYVHLVYIYIHCMHNFSQYFYSRGKRWWRC